MYGCPSHFQYVPIQCQLRYGCSFKSSKHLLSRQISLSDVVIYDIGSKLPNTSKPSIGGIYLLAVPWQENSSISGFRTFPNGSDELNESE